jgi:hypothetical protein
MNSEREQELLKKKPNELTDAETAEWHASHIYVWQQQTDGEWLDFPYDPTQPTGDEVELLHAGGAPVRLIRRNTTTGAEEVIRQHER